MLAAVLAARSGAALAQGCATVSAGVDPAGSIVGYTTMTGAQIFITKTYPDSSAGFRSPSLGDVVGISAAIEQYDRDPPGQLIPMRCPFIPPHVLPKRDLDAFFVKPVSQSTTIAWYLVAHANTKPYAPGMLWVTQRAGASPPEGAGYDDLAFSVEYCKDTVVPVRRDTWGRLKLIYR